MINELRRDATGEVFSYTFLMDHLKDYVNPRGKIGRMMRAGEIIRVRKGLYVFGQDYRKGPINRGILANLIYGPSYVSGLYALAHHGLIPERVETVTSMTPQRNKKFITPFGRFEYLYLNLDRYAVGIEWRRVGEAEHCLFASAEKALADVLARERDLLSIDDLLEFMVENLRIEEDLLTELKLSSMNKIAVAYRSPVVSLLNELLARLAP